MGFTKKRVQNGQYDVFAPDGQLVATVTKNVMYGVTPWIWSLASGLDWSDQLNGYDGIFRRRTHGCHDTLSNAFDAVATRVEVHGVAATTTSS